MISAVLMFGGTDVYAAVSYLCDTGVCVVGQTDVHMGENCKTYRTDGYGHSSSDGYCVESCASCDTANGYTLTQKTTLLGNCLNTIYYYTCDFTGVDPGLSECQTTLYDGSNCATNSSLQPTFNKVENCLFSRQICFGGKLYETCSRCQTGYNLMDATMLVLGCSNMLEYQTCSGSGGSQPSFCTNDSQCQSLTTTWGRPEGAGLGSVSYQARTYGRCMGGTCIGEVQNRCASGYYGQGVDCEPCPDAPDSAVETSDGLLLVLSPISSDVADSSPFATTINDCYMMARRSRQDDTGVWEYSSNCYYQ